MAPTILLVEDNQDDEELTISSLRDARIKNKIDVVRDGAEALEYLEQRGKYEKVDTPQIILLDLKLPKINGLEILKFIRTSPMLQHLPVVIFTSSKEEKDLIEGYKLGANSYIQKPVDFDEFAKAVNDLGLYWIVLNQYPLKMDQSSEKIKATAV